MLLFVLITCGFTGLAFSPALIRYFSLTPPPDTTVPLVQDNPASNVPAEAQPGLPLRLRIPKINVSAAVDHVGLTPAGDLSAPKGPDNAGWYKIGPRPGEKGNAVMDGHFGWVNGKPAIFDNLHTLVKGDLLYVDDEQGTTFTFVVSGSRPYSPNEDATAVFRSIDGKARLNLITCQGAWNQAQDSYATRLVVFADLL